VVLKHKLRSVLTEKKVRSLLTLCFFFTRSGLWNVDGADAEATSPNLMTTSIPICAGSCGHPTASGAETQAPIGDDGEKGALAAHFVLFLLDVC
jgi:hypothetical protein